MQSSLTVPVLSLAAEAVRDLEGQDAILGLWNVFTKCKSSLQDGRRLENISWRLWYREMAGLHSQGSSSSSATTPSLELDTPLLISPTPSPSSGSSEASSPKGADFLPPPIIQSIPSSDTLYSTRSGSHVPIGRIIFDHILPEKISSTLPPRRRSADQSQTLDKSTASTPVPSVVLPSTPPNTAYPKVIIVNPTPHPTPPATPQSMPMQQHFLPQQYSINRLNVQVTLSTKSGYLAPPPRTLGVNIGGEEPVPLSASAPKTNRHGSISAVSSSSSPKVVADDEGSPKLVPSSFSQPKFFIKESPERFDSSPDREGIDVPQSSDVGEGASSHGDSSNVALSVVSEKAPSSITSKTDSVGSRSNVISSKRGKTGITVGARRKGGHVARPPRPMNHRISSRFGQKKVKSSTNIAGAVGVTAPLPVVSQVGLKRTASTRSEGRALPPPQPPPPASILPTPPAVPTVVARTSSDKPNTGASRRGIVVDNSSTDYETTDDSDDGLEWASEDLSPEEALAQKRKEKKKEEDERARREEEERRKVDQELFAKLPRISYAQLPKMSADGPGQRTRSVGLLTQLLNPDPSMFPQNYPYRPRFSTEDMTQHTKGSGVTMSRVSAAAPVAAQVNAPAQIVDIRAGSGGKYRPRGRPEGAEMDDDSDEEDENKIELSASLAQQKLAALAGPHRRRMAAEDMRIQQQQQQQLPEAGPSSRRYALTSVSSAPIPLSHPYNLPAPAAPSTPRTTRRKMLATELSESLRRNLLWERQISKVGGGVKRSVSAFGGNGLRPLTTMTPPPNNNEVGTSGSSSHGGASGEEAGVGVVASKDERRRNALIRNRSWADDYHISGW